MKRKAEKGGLIFSARLLYEVFPEFYAYKLLTALILLLPAALIRGLLKLLAGGVLTTANYKAVLISWRAPVMLLLGLLLILCYVAVEIFGQIHLTEALLTGKPGGIRLNIRKGICSIRDFLTPYGLLVLLYSLIIVPLGGIGLYISLTKDFYIPNFIMDVVNTNPYYYGLYGLAMIGLAWFGFRAIFAIHGVLLSALPVKEAFRQSFILTRAHRRELIGGMLKVYLKLFLLLLLLMAITASLNQFIFEPMGEGLPLNYSIDLERFFSAAGADPLDLRIIRYRVWSAFFILMNAYIFMFFSLLATAYINLKLTDFYLTYTAKLSSMWSSRPRRHYWIKLFIAIFSFIFIFVASLALGVLFNEIFATNETVKIIAHRGGGDLAVENTPEGLKAAIDAQCYGSEIDIQRSKDGRYVVHHDKTLKRIWGRKERVQDLTFETLHALGLPGLEEMLSLAKGKIKLFIELKGETADKQMADDLAAIIMAGGYQDEVALISLKYDIIDYIERSYPSLETGTVFFAGLGDFNRLNCDLLIVEETVATEKRIEQAHKGGKQIIVWTVNQDDSLAYFLDQKVDAVITDKVMEARQEKARLSKRSDRERLEDGLSKFLR